MYFPPFKSLIHILTGHGRFPFYLHRFNLALHSYCPCGQECNTILHYFNECCITAPLVATLTRPGHPLPITTEEFPDLLAVRKNRALLIKMEKTIDELLPDYIRPQLNPDGS